MRRSGTFLPLALSLLSAVVAGAAAGQEDLVEDLVARGDAAWARRAEGHRGGRAAAAAIDEAIAAYEREIAARPGGLEARWKLLQAIYFKGEFVAATREAKQEVFGRGRAVAEGALDLLAGRLGGASGGRVRFDAMSPKEVAGALSGVPDAAPVVLWSGVVWGLWGDAFGRIAAARQGAGDRIRRYGEVGRAIDERYESAAGDRLLGRLHALAPKIPFVTGWVDREKAVAHLRRAVELAPDDAYNRLYLAEALLEHQPAKRAEALEILRRLVARPPAPARPARIVEEEKAREAARALLAEHRR